MYDDCRFLTITGKHLPHTPMTINERQAELDAFHADVFAERILKRERARRPPQITSMVYRGATPIYSTAPAARGTANASRDCTTRAHGKLTSHRNPRATSGYWPG